jgi:hypothetical protein
VRRIDERNVGERLRELAHQALITGVVLAGFMRNVMESTKVVAI